MAYDRDTGEEQLRLDDMQGDILVGLQKDHESFLSFRIADVARFKRFIKNLASDITTGRKALERELQIQAQKASGQRRRLSFIGVNIGFTFSGLSALGVDGLESIRDQAFKDGLFARSAALGDPVAGAGSPAEWKAGGDERLHGIVIVTGPDGERVADRVAALKTAAGNRWEILFEEEGKTRPSDRGHEHFGFLDGVSQPAVRGQVDHLFPGMRFLNPSLNPRNPGQGLPGADLHWPGEFVFGYNEQLAETVDEPGPAAEGGLPWMKDGSYMVYRRLKQLVPEFDAFVGETAIGHNMDPQLLAARMVGRWKSGAPVSLSPLQDNSAQGEDVMLNNDFEFGDDAAARRCPFAAHIRKTYPRDDVTPAGTGEATDAARREASEADTQTHRIMRRGIPFGEEVTDDEAAQEVTTLERGLQFVSYQTSIEDQFEFIIKNWVNNRDFASGDVGVDPILGQTQGAVRDRDFLGAVVNYPTGPVGGLTQIATDFIVPTGGGYFFMPSIRALKRVLGS